MIHDYYNYFLEKFKKRHLKKYYQIISKPHLCHDLFNECWRRIFQIDKEDIKNGFDVRLKGLIREQETPANLLRYFYQTTDSVMLDYLKLNPYKRADKHDTYNTVFLNLIDSGTDKEKAGDQSNAPSMQSVLDKDYFEAIQFRQKEYLDNIDLISDKKGIEAVEKIFSELKPDELDLLSLINIDGESLRGIARRNKTNAENIRQKNKRILKKVKTRFQELFPDIEKEDRYQLVRLFQYKLKKWSYGDYDR